MSLCPLLRSCLTWGHALSGAGAAHMPWSTLALSWAVRAPRVGWWCFWSCASSCPPSEGLTPACPRKALSQNLHPETLWGGAFFGGKRQEDTFGEKIIPERSPKGTGRNYPSPCVGKTVAKFIAFNKTEGLPMIRPLYHTPSSSVCGALPNQCRGEVKLA